MIASIASIHHGVPRCQRAWCNSTGIARGETKSTARVVKGIPVLRREGRTIMVRLFQNITHASVKIDSFAENIENQGQALIFMIAIQAYLDMVLYKKNLLKTLANGIQRNVKHQVEQQHRYSVVFFLHPWEPSGKSYGAYLFSLIPLCQYK